MTIKLSKKIEFIFKIMKKYRFLSNYDHQFQNIECY